MGRDKALLDHDGMAMALRVVMALRAAGADDVTAIGGDLPALTVLGIAAAPDDHPGEGPLAGVLTALSRAAHDLVVVLACDLLHPDPGAVRAVVDALRAAPESTLAAVPMAGGRLQPLHAGYRRAAAVPLRLAFSRGERAIHRALEPLDVLVVDGLADAALADADVPGDLGR